jgi:hypothetical protein
MYDELRANGRRHHAAVRALARRLQVDEGTVKRVLQRAQNDQRATGRTGQRADAAGE